MRDARKVKKQASQRVPNDELQEPATPTLKPMNSFNMNSMKKFESIGDEYFDKKDDVFARL